MLAEVVLAVMCRCPQAPGHAAAAALLSVPALAQAAVASVLAVLTELAVLAAPCVWTGAMLTASMWRLVLRAQRRMQRAEACRCALVAASAPVARLPAVAACRCAVEAAIRPMAAAWLSHRRTRPDAAAVAEACRSCQAHRLVAAAALSLYAVVLVAAMCACMSVLAAAVRAAICVLAQATAATAVLAALAGQ